MESTGRLGLGRPALRPMRSSMTSERGLTLLEVMVALVVLSLVALGYLRLFQGSHRLVAAARGWAQAGGDAEDARGGGKPGGPGRPPWPGATPARGASPGGTRPPRVPPRAPV